MLGELFSTFSRNLSSLEVAPIQLGHICSLLSSPKYATTTLDPPMIPQTPSSNVAPDSSAEKLLRLGAPFVDFPRYSILDIQRERNYDGTPVPFSEWLTRHLQAGKPFVIQDFDKLDTWPRAPAASVQTEGATSNFTLDRLIELSTKKNIPIRNCSTGRDLQFTLSKFVESARQSFPEFQNLYARDLPCPQEWLQQCRALLPPEVQWSGRQDLFQWLPQCARSEVMMAYVGSEGSCSGFHRCFSSTVALNFLIDTEGTCMAHTADEIWHPLTRW